MTADNRKHRARDDDQQVRPGDPHLAVVLAIREQTRKLPRVDANGNPLPPDAA